MMWIRVSVFAVRNAEAMAARIFIWWFGFPQPSILNRAILKSRARARGNATDWFRVARDDIDGALFQVCDETASDCERRMVCYCHHFVIHGCGLASHGLAPVALGCHCFAVLVLVSAIPSKVDTEAGARNSDMHRKKCSGLRSTRY